MSEPRLRAAATAATGLALASASPWRLCVAPMMEWTDRHCRHFHRLITRRTRLYTVMITTGALLHGDVGKHLDFGAVEHPVALQLGGSEPDDLAACARLAQRWGYDEVNLNCGCPSERVQRGAFGACLMREAALVRDCVAAMRDAVGASMAVSVKHRIGVDRVESYEFVRDFVGSVADGGCEVFIVHARNAWLQGLSPKDNRDVPPLRYDFVHRLKREFPHLTVVINGGIASNEAIAGQFASVDGVMVGRAAYHDPGLMRRWDSDFLGAPAPREAPSEDDWREIVERSVVDYLERLVDVPWPHAARHMLGLWHGRPGARRWRQVWSDHRMKDRPPREVHALATAARVQAARAAAGPAADAVHA